MKLQIIPAHGIRFACYVHGHGPTLLLLLHGFPDDAATMLRLMERLDPTRFTMIAPHMRGYAPTSRAADRRYHYAELGQDVLAILHTIPHQQARIYGHGFGALAAYAAAQLEPSAIHHLFAACAPPLTTLLANVRRAPHRARPLLRLLKLQVPLLGHHLMHHDPQRFIEDSWRTWSPDWRFEPTRLAKVHSSLMRRSVQDTALRYHRALLLDALLDHGAWRQSVALAKTPIATPTTFIIGAQDGLIHPNLFDRVEHAMAPDTPHHIALLDPCGHYPHHEQLDTCAELLQSP